MHRHIVSDLHVAIVRLEIEHVVSDLRLKKRLRTQIRKLVVRKLKVRNYKQTRDTGPSHAPKHLKKSFRKAFKRFSIVNWEVYSCELGHNLQQIELCW